MTYKNCPPVLEGYLRYLEIVKNQSRSTILNKLSDIRGLLQFIQARSLPEDPTLKLSGVAVADMRAATVAGITEEDIEDYIEYLASDAKVSPNSIRRRKLVSFRRFFDYLIRHQEDLGIFIAANPVMDGAPGINPENPGRVLSPSEVKRLLNAMDGATAGRDTAIVLLILTTGLSVSQIVKLRCQDYREDILLVDNRKIYLTGACQDALNAYLQTFRDPIDDLIHDNTIFVSDNYFRRLTPRAVQKALEKQFARAGIQATARDLQFTAVTELLKTARNDCERAYIAGYLGYTSMDFLRKHGLQKPSSTASAPVDMVENTWLADLEAKHD